MYNARILAVTLLGAVLRLWAFGRVALLGPLTNLLADPVMGLLQPLLFVAMVLDRNMPRELHDIRKNDVVPDPAIVPDVDVRHEQTVFADRRLERMSGTAIDRRVFANDGAVVHFHGRFLASVLEILGGSAEYCADADFHATT